MGDVDTSTAIPLSVERKIELLEPRFTAPSTPQHHAASCSIGFGNDSSNSNNNNIINSNNNNNINNNAITTSASNSELSFSFGVSTPTTSSSLPPSAVRSRRRPSVTTSTHAVSMAAARHIRKVAASSPIQGFSSNNPPATATNNNNNTASNASCSSSSHTLLTSHVQQRQVAESPPVVVSPTTGPTSGKTASPKPAAARNLYHETKSNGSTATSSSISTVSVLLSILVYFHNIVRLCSHLFVYYFLCIIFQKRKSNPKRKQASIKDKSSNNNIASPEPKRPKNEPEHSPQAGSFSENSRDRSNLGKSSKASKIIRPVNNKTMHDFFQATTTSKKKREPSGGDTDNDSVNTTNSISTATTTTPSATTASNIISSTTTTPATPDWQTRCLKLQQLVQDKDEQLKAVSNNKTILHTALQTALQKTKNELVHEKSQNEKRREQSSGVLEDLLRWKSTRQAKEVRETLASDGARLGRIVVSRAGMRAVESWEEGYATRDLEHRKQKLQELRRVLEERLKATTMTQQQNNNNDKENHQNQNQLEAIEARESLHMHLEGVHAKERELAEEEQALNDEKGAHIRALKRVASEDASRFRARPKVRDDYY
jgi:hypothetical protein